MKHPVLCRLTTFICMILFCAGQCLCQTVLEEVISEGVTGSISELPEKAGVKRIAILLLAGDEMARITDRIITEVVKRDIYEVIERRQLEKLLREASFQMTGIVDPDTAVEAGRIAGVDAVMYGSIKRLEYGKDWADVSYHIQMVNVETGQIFWADDVAGEVGTRPELFEDQVAELMGRLLAKVPASGEDEIRVYINAPRYLHWGTTEEPDLLIGGGFRRYLLTCCESAVDMPFSLIPREEFKQIWAEVKLAEVSEASGVDEVFGGLKKLVSNEVVTPLDAIIMLDYSIPEGSKTTIKTSLYILDVRRVRKYVVVGTLRELTEGIVEEAQKKPANHQEIVEQKENISNMLPDDVSEEDRFDLSVRVDRGAGGVYVEEEKMTIDVSTEEDCYIAVFNINAQGKTNVLFPNPWEQNNLIRAGELRQIPAPESKDYDLVISGPFGIETIKVVASRTPFQVDSLIKGNEAAFPELSKGISRGAAFPGFGSGGLAKSIDTMKSLTRSVVAQARITYPEQKMRFAEAQCFFTTVPRSTRGLWAQ